MADTLLCSTIQSINSETTTFDLIADEQQKDATLDKVREDISLQLKEHPIPFGTKHYFAMWGLVIQDHTYHLH